MEKTYKLVPDVEALRYKGTPDKPDIKIFVSHRIDLDSETIDNPLYIPVRCGAVYDERENVDMLGDDTGDNISEKRMSYCELTVLYWAWKNVDADYYGLSHYRRYISFSEERIPGAWQRQGFLDSMSKSNLQVSRLLDEEYIRQRIKSQDMILPTEFEVCDVQTPNGSNYKNVYDYLTRAWENLFVKKEDIDLTLQVIQKYFPQYYRSATRYMKSKKFRGFNIFILKKELFDSLCQFEFGVLAKVLPKIDYENASTSRKRMPGFLGEMLYSIWTYHQKISKSYEISEQQLIFYQDTKREKALSPADKNTVVICYRTSFHELELLGVSIKSLLMHCDSEKNYQIIVLLKNVPENKFFVKEQERRKQLIIDMAKEKYNVSLCFYDPKDDLGKIDARLFTEEDNKYRYYSLFMPWILKKFSRVICLSSHTVIQTDVGELMDFDLENHAIAGVKDILVLGTANGYGSAKKHYIDDLKMSNAHNYIDTDVLVMDLHKIRKRYDFDTLYSRCVADSEDTLSPDRDIFNMAYEELITFMPYSWNYPNLPTPDFLQCIDYAEAEQTELFFAVKHPKIVNFRNYPAPWIVPLSDQGPCFWKIAKLTMFYESILAMQRATLSAEACTNHDSLLHRLFPVGTKRRKIMKFFFPKNSFHRRLIEKIILH